MSYIFHFIYTVTSTDIPKANRLHQEENNTFTSKCKLYVCKYQYQECLISHTIIRTTSGLWLQTLTHSKLVFSLFSHINILVYLFIFQAIRARLHYPTLHRVATYSKYGTKCFNRTTCAVYRDSSV